MNFYQQNPGVQNEFAQAAQRGSNGNASAVATDNTSSSSMPPVGDPNQLSAFNAQEGYAPGTIQQVNPATDPMFNAMKSGMPAGDMQEMSNPWSISGAPMSVPAGHQWNPFSISGYADGGPVGYDLGGSVDADNDLDDALQAVQEAFAFGRQKHGLDRQAQASAIPSAPGGGGDSPRPLPMPGPLPPTNNPFGKRQNPFPAGKTASALPMVPGNPSDSGIPRPQPPMGPLPPTSNPFGKRTNPPPYKTGEADTGDDEEA